MRPREREEAEMEATEVRRWRRVPGVLLGLVLTAGLAGAAAADGTPPSTERVALSSSGGQPDADILNGASLTPDARYVAFASGSATLATGALGGTGPFVYVRDRALGTTELVSRGGGGAAPNGGSGG